MTFKIGGLIWRIESVPEYSDMLLRSDGSRTVGVCDRNTLTISISNLLQGAFLRKVLCHEVCHAAMFSHGVDMSIDQEELFCDLMATYGDEIIGITDDIFRILKARVA